MNQRELMDAGVDGIYNKNGETQVPHQILSFNTKELGSPTTKLNKNLIDWNQTKIIPFDNSKHGYLEADNEERKYY